MFLCNAKNRRMHRLLACVLTVSMCFLLLIPNGMIVSVSANGGASPYADGENLPPEGNQISSYSIAEGTNLSGTVTVTDPDGDALTFRMDPHNGDPDTSKGTFTLDSATGEWSYTPPAGSGMAGEIVNYYIEASDGQDTFHQRIEIRIEPTPTNITYHVDGDNGDDSNDGLTPETALRTIRKAASKVCPGDTVIIHETEEPYPQVLTLSRSGLPEAYITYKAAEGEKPVINAGVNWNTIKITGSYIILDGLTIEGIAKDFIDEMDENYGYYNYRLTQGRLPNNVEKFNTNGISFSQDNGMAPGDLGIDAVKVIHHIEIRNCVVDSVGGGGIGGSGCDYITLENNTITNCCWGDMWACSGISVLGTIDIDDNFDEHKIVIKDNITAGNRHFVPWISVEKFSDGNGIIIDSTDNAKTSRNLINKGDNWGLQPYYGKFLVANNLSYFNGGSGIHAYDAANVDIINNTIYHNSATPALQNGYSELFSNSSDNINMYNNIVYSRTDLLMHISGSTSSNVVYDNNLFYNYSSSNNNLNQNIAGNNGKPGTTAGANNIYGENPLFANVYEVNYDKGIAYRDDWEDYMFDYARDGGYFIGADYDVNILEFDFSLQDGSPALGSGNREWSELLGNTENRMGIFGTIGSPMRSVTVSDNQEDTDPSDCQGATDTEWTTDETHHWHGCECEEKHDYEKHTPADEWEVIAEATETTTGEQVLKCSVCKRILQTEELPVLELEEESNDLVWILLMMLTKKYTITAEAGEGGTISSLGETKVRYNHDVTYTITPEDGYAVASVLVNGEDVGSVTTYTFDNVRKNHTITVIFKRLS